MERKLIVIMCFALVISLYFMTLAISAGQTEWWDSTEYLLKAKSLALGTPSIGFAAHREIIPALIYYPFFKLGVGEIGIRVFMIALGMLGIYLAYLLGRDMFNKNVGLITALLMATLSTYIFNMNRLTMYTFAPVLFMGAIYLFWRYYRFHEVAKIYYSFVLIGIGITIYYNTAFALIVIGVFLLLTNRQFYKDKHIWLAGLLTIFILSPYFIYSQLTYGSPLPRLSETMRAASEETGAPLLQAIMAYPSLIPKMLLIPGTILLVIGIVLSYRFFLGIDLILKGKMEEERPNLIVYLWVIVPTILYTWTVASLAGGTVVMPEYIMVIFPALFMIIANGLLFIHSKLNRFSNVLSVGVIVLLLIASILYQLNAADQLVKSRLNSYREIQEAGDIIKQRTQPGDWVVTASVPQMVYYSERSVTGIARDISEQDWLNQTIALHPKYLFWSVYEPHPDWIYGYIQASINKSELYPIKGWGTQTQPTAILFQYNN